MDNNQGFREIEKRDTHNAISSWSGYDYQGKVGIYWVLYLINQMEIPYQNIKDFTLEIEHLEDFTIKYQGNPHTIHQVKSYQEKSTISAYKEAILELMGKCAKYESINSMYLHTCISIQVPEKNELKNLLLATNPDSKIEQFKEYKKLLFEEDKFEEVYLKLFFNNTDEDSCKKVISVLEIDSEIKTQIKKFYKKNKGFLKIQFAESEENVKYIFHNFLHEINQFVALSHKKKIKNPEIPFWNFLDTLKNDFVFKFSKKTATSMLKYDLEEYFLQYCEKEGINPNECIIWNKNWQTICSMSDDEFLLLCKKLSPTINVNVESIMVSDYKEMLVKSGVHKTLFPMVLEADDFALQHEDVKDMFVLNKSGIHHLITTIAEESGKFAVEIQGRQVFKALKDDNRLTLMLFDIHKLITNELDGAFDGNIVDVRHAYQEFIQELEIKETITIPKRMEFIAVHKAKEEFK
ncbi:ABC-three component system protein [Bacillus sp. AFS029533]|uniref:ABC-three component system protein n=1 Tax=Bacillus sp. AFS029533 TaxID=2033494 RepID=UPI000BFDA2E2|nr:ABC-three component system protein [Bacillus sp. AFS029533]PGZ90948.1 hypothetical protein COE53_16565 [Bacillus sp. AFS029533]